MTDSSEIILAVTQDGYLNSGHRVSAIEIIKSRLGNNTWPLYANTRNRRTIAGGDVLIFYVGGQRLHGGYVVATADVEKCTDSGR